MDSVKNIIDSLKSTSGRNDKISILKSNKDNSLWTEVLKFLFDPMVVTGISDKKISKDVDNSMAVPMGGLLDVLNYLRVHNTGTLVDIATVSAFAKANPTHSEWLLQLCTKSLKLGVDVSTINKVYGKDFIRVFAVMLADSLSGNEKYLEGKEFILTQKLDGLRCVAVVYDNGTVKFFTRNGQDYGDVPDVAADLLSLPMRNVVYDGELIAASKKNNTNEVFRETSSVARRDGVKRGLIYHVFDFLPLDDFMSGKCDTPCKLRKLNLNMLLRNASTEWVEEVKILYLGNRVDKIPKFLDFALEKGWEGLMINLADAAYESKRTRSLLKVKQFKTIDVRITGVYEGEGENIGRLGGITCEFDFGGTPHSTKCGSGFTSEQRDMYWRNPDLLIGKIAEIKFFEISQNADGTHSLRFPIWLDRIRFDKDDTSSY